MLYLFTGRDVAASALKRDKKLEAVLKLKPSAEVVSLNDENWNANIIDEYAGAQGLFQKDFIISISFVCDNKVFAEELIEKLDLAQESSNVFIFLERELPKDILKLFTKSAEEIVESDKVVAKGRPFNVFSLADAFGRRDKKGLWVLLQEARRAGIADEQIHGTIWWQVKTLLLVSSAATPKEAGVGDFPFRNAKRFLSNFKSGELEKFAHELVSFYHNVRRGLSDMDIALEKFVLSV